MDVHRCRFVPYQPSAINAVAFSHPRARTSKQAAVARLAIGRANGDIEIWNPSQGAWHQELVIRGGKDRSIDGLIWVNEPDQDLGDGRVRAGRSRLFSIGYTSTVTEWDLEKGKPKRHASGQHGDLWCLTAQPLSTLNDRAQANGSAAEPQAPNKLIAGTIDGELVIYSIEDDDLRFQRVLVRSPTKKAQMVSITFQSRKVVIVGCSDSTIRAYDFTRGHLLRRMTLGSDVTGGSKDIIVWSVQCLPNGDIVSGDSTGQLCIWDGKTYTQIQRIHSHKQDILSLAVSSDGSTILSGGMDRRSTLYKPNSSSSHRWTKVWSRRYHDHDVKTMASFESGPMSVVVSGGPDSNPVVMPLKEMGRENHRMISTLPQQPPIASANKARFIVSWWEREVHIWVLRQSATELFNAGAEDSDLNENRKLLKIIVVKGDSNISSATIDQDGKLLIVSTAIDVKAFQLEHSNPSKPSDLKISSVELPQKLTRLGASHVQLSPDKKWLGLVQEGSRILLAKSTVTDNEKVTFPSNSVYKATRLRRHIPRHVRNGGLGSYDRNITHVAFSPDSRMLATADVAGYIDTWVLRRSGEGAQNGVEEDSSSSSEADSADEENAEIDTTATEQWIRNPNGKLLPKLPSAPVVLSFSEVVPAEASEDSEKRKDYTLLAITSTWTLSTFHPLQGSLTPWSRRNPRKSLPAPILDLLDLAKGVFWQGERVWIYGASFLAMIDLGQDLPKPGKTAETMVEYTGSKRKRRGPTTGAGGKMELGNLKPHQIHKHVAGNDEDVVMEEAKTEYDYANSDDDDDDVDGTVAEIAQLRNPGHGESIGSTDLVEVGGSYRRSWWMTYKYRPIFGIVTLGADSEAPEVALVERPTWDVDMPVRYF